ncbi:GNAT family N-acetyltransferase [Pseudoalteromonas sp. KG3]|jgi:N-acetylglutamate synthase-like GNAT family acetyltransferase|uniref:GNAT family N-acetyltransferase n=1 Tax=Pseudoalteromonas prydzensis TaxID=182141 RepID=A0ABR9FM24_9GAMM|nr:MULTISPECIES: GNAT family N-acetyltransferase [Pseudoalteromonas]MBE0457870.1 GNAT family N-acetyltransferase [Pseudoalteromonas prydzensis]WKD25055.1 GNAT family N-acetyltransferase [Pseudoalteromonas sp. KG3]
MNTLRFERLAAIKTPLVNKFYSQHNARGRATKHDQVWVAYHDFAIVAACRIQNRSDYLFLSTVLVAPTRRRQGLAKQLLKYALVEQNSHVYTFAYAELTDFYKSIGFNFVLTLPSALDTLFAVYQQRNIVAMQY